jgi:hypothetical protein
MKNGIKAIIVAAIFLLGKSLNAQEFKSDPIKFLEDVESFLTKGGDRKLAKDFIKDFGSNVFTNLVKDTFTRSYIKKHPCSDCGKPSTDRCHGIGEERPLLIKRALEKVWSDTSNPIIMKEIIIAFLEEHKYTKFTFIRRILNH